MPAVKEFKDKNHDKGHSHKAHAHKHTDHDLHESAQKQKHADNEHKAKRRPGREHHADTEIEIEVEAAPEAETKAETKKKIEVSFPGSEVLRAKLPKSFKVADAIATDWVNDGKFEGLPVGHPLAQVVAASGLRKAKDLEKKVVDSGVVEKVAMKALNLGMKAQTEINTIREQVKAKFGRK